MSPTHGYPNVMDDLSSSATHSIENLTTALEPSGYGKTNVLGDPVQVTREAIRI
jgi:hypothetical protein